MKNYNPDVLTCLANLSNDEVFTPPVVVNRMLDLLPAELWRNPDARFLDPVSKTGVFLREIAKRLMEGLSERIPDRQQRADHIFTRQLFGLAITELTALLSRRSVYCSKQANGPYSVCTAFHDADGNIRFRSTEHSWQNGRCRYCGASREVYDRDDTLESHAYEFIHTENPETIFPDMKFDVIIGNPPYQLEVGIEKDNYAIPLYHKFIQQAKKLRPRFISMIIPSRWFAGGRGMDDFREEMLHDTRLQILVDYPNAADCFPGIDLSGGVCYFLWNSEYNGICKIVSNRGKDYQSTMNRPLLEPGNDTFIRFNEAIPIIRKIIAYKEPTFDSLVSPQTPFGIVSSFKDYSDKPFEESIAIYTVNGIKYIREDQVSKNRQWISPYKVFISKSYGERGAYPYRFLAKPFIGTPRSCCTQTYLMIGPFNTSIECENVISYINTRFFRFCIMQKKNTQDAMRGVYSYVPIQDFSQSWTDEKLYAKYGITDEEIKFIESMVRPME
ncbi:Eco57I restriction-modification methylase domain-containing protein [Alistipes sp.]|jgi:site-specific DNA-methyltransferase (adenine-specific)|uniref:Eco57I restriction-modification methylase domain-containing protein n=1 Tax=Alistipes sp. TaxID=1872444 RepID=UPI003A87893D